LKILLSLFFGVLVVSSFEDFVVPYFEDIVVPFCGDLVVPSFEDLSIPFCGHIDVPSFEDLVVPFLWRSCCPFCGFLVVPSCGVPAIFFSAMVNTLFSILVRYLLELSCNGLYLGKIFLMSISHR
jgi:hypothetical protein